MSYSFNLANKSINKHVQIRRKFFERIILLKEFSWRISFLQVALIFAVIACVAGKPGIVAPLAYSAPLVHSAAYTAPIAAYSSPVAYSAYSAPVAYSAYSSPVAYNAAYTAPVAYAAPSYSNSFLYKAPPTKFIAAPATTLLV